MEVSTNKLLQMGLKLRFCFVWRPTALNNNQKPANIHTKLMLLVMGKREKDEIKKSSTDVER